MSRILIKPPGRASFGTTGLRLASTDSRSERLEARLAELDASHLVEARRISGFLQAVRRRYGKVRQGGGTHGR